MQNAEERNQSRIILEGEISDEYKKILDKKRVGYDKQHVFKPETMNRELIENSEVIRKKLEEWQKVSIWRNDSLM